MKARAAVFVALLAVVAAWPGCLPDPRCAPYHCDPAPA